MKNGARARHDRAIAFFLALCGQHAIPWRHVPVHVADPVPFSVCSTGNLSKQKPTIILICLSLALLLHYTMPGKKTTYEINLSTSDSDTDSPVLVQKVCRRATTPVNDDWSFSSQQSDTKITGRKIQVDASLFSAKETPTGRGLSLSNKMNSSKRPRMTPASDSAVLREEGNDNDKKQAIYPSNKNESTTRRKPVTSRNNKTSSVRPRTTCRPLKSPLTSPKLLQSRQQSTCAISATFPSDKPDRNKNYYTHDEAEAFGPSSDSENEIPYTQNLKVPDGRNVLRRRMDALVDSDEDEQLLRRKEPIRPGDVISYYHPTYVYGNSTGYRVSQVLGTSKTATDGCLDLDNGEFLPADTLIKRVGEFRRGRVIPHPGVVREIKQFRLRARRLTGAASGLERQVERLRQTVLQAQKELRQVPERLRQPNIEDEDENSDSSPVDQADTVSDTTNSRSQKQRKGEPNSKNDTYGTEPIHNVMSECKKLAGSDSSSDDSLLKEYLEQSGKNAKSKSPAHNIQDICDPPMKENALASSQESNRAQDTGLKSSPFSVKSNLVPNTDASNVGNSRATPSTSSCFSLTRVSQGRPTVSTIYSPRTRHKNPKLKPLSSPDTLLDTDGSEDDDLLMVPVFNSKKSPSTPKSSFQGAVPASSNSSSNTTPGMSLLSLASEKKTQPANDSGISSLSRPPRPSSPSHVAIRHSFSIKDKVQRRTRAWSETPPTIQQAEGEALDASDEDDALSIASSNRHVRHRASTQKKLRKLSDDQKKKQNKAKSPPNNSPFKHPSIFRPTEVERSDQNMYKDLLLSSDEEGEEKHRPCYRNPLTFCDESIGSFRPEKPIKLKNWLQNLHAKSRASSEQAGAMLLSFKPVNHSEL